MQLNDIISTNDIRPEDVTVLFHVSNRPDLLKALPMLAEEEPKLFDAFQNQHGPSAEATIKKRPYILSLVNTVERDYRLVGLFEIKSSTYWTNAELDADPLRKELITRFPSTSYVENGKVKGEAGRLVFDLSLCDAMQELIGRLAVEKPAARAYARLAENLDCPVKEITRNRELIPLAPNWDKFIVTAMEIRNLPRTHAARLREWRGVYLIVDESDGARYVGSAYGNENILGRWRTHVTGEAVDSKELRKRNIEDLRFSILQLTAQDADLHDVINLEQNWMDRLHTREFGLNR